MKVKAEMKYCGDRGTVSVAVTVIRRVDNERNVVREHFVDIKDDTSVCGTTERVPTDNGESVRSRGREKLNG